MRLDLGDDDLMRQYQDGNLAAGGVLFERHQSPLLGYLRRLVGSLSDAEDLLQEVFLKAHQARGQYVAQGQFRSWLYKIATNSAYNHLENQQQLWNRRVISINDGDESDEGAARIEPPDTKDTPREALEGQELAAAIERAIENLPLRSRTVFLLRQKQKLPYSAIAEIVNEPEQRLRVQYHRARKALFEEAQPWLSNSNHKGKK